MPARPSARTKRAAATRQALLRVGAEVFAEQGFEGARVDAIARRARVNKAMINYHFGGKGGLYGAILDATFGPARERVTRLRESEGSAEERLRELVQVYVEMTRDWPTLPTMVLREVLAGGRRLDARFVPYVKAQYAALESVVAQGVKEGVYRRHEPFLTHLVLAGSLTFFLATRAFRERLRAEAKLPAAGASFDDFAAHLEQIVGRGLARGPARAARPAREVPPARKVPPTRRRKRRAAS